MKNLIKAVALFVFFTGYNIDAQYIVKKDTIAGNTVNMTMDSRVEQLLNKQEESCNRTNSSVSDGTKATTPKIVVPSRELTNTEICKQNPKIMGYKIQVAVVKSNEEARKIGADFRKNFPNLKVEIDASLRPNYKILAGSYFSKKSAAEDLRRVKQVYESALSTQYRVFCVEAK